MRAVRFDRYGGVDELYVADVAEPSAGPGQVVVAVVAAAVNPGEAAIREGLMDEQFPATFPSGQGSDFAGVVHAVGPDANGWQVGDEVFGWTDERAAHADYVAVPSDQVTTRPPAAAWEQVASVHVAGCTAYGLVRTVPPVAGETVAVSGAAGGVGSALVQLLRREGVRILAIAGRDNDDWLRAHGAEPVRYGDGLGPRLRALAPDGIDAFLDCHGDGYVALAIGHGVDPSRVATIIDFAGAEQAGAQTVMGYDFTSAAVLAELGELVADGDLEFPVAAVYPLEDVRSAYTELARGHTRGKILLRMR